MISADLHLHTKYSQDSFLDPKLLLKIAFKRGLSVVAITDHNSMKCLPLALSIARSLPNFFVIPGMEIKTDLGDLIALFIEDAIKARSYYDVLDEIKKQNGISVIPHLFIKHNIKLTDLIHVDLIEALNGRIPQLYNSKASEVARKINKPVVAGSDSHTFFEIGCVRNTYYDNISNLEDLRSIIVKNKSIFSGKESTCGVHLLSLGAELLKKRLTSSLV